MSNVITSPASTDPEAARLAALARYDILDTPPEPAFDRVARLVQMIFDVPSSAVSLIDAHRQWIKASCGVGVPELPLRDTFCNKTLRSDQPLIVPDLSQDPRFVDNPYVRGDMAVRFYAGTPIRTADGHNIGTVCAMDKKPRSFSENEVKILTELAQIVMDELELRQLASTDGLTGLSTRRAFKDQAERFVALARRHRSPLTAIAFDIDHFKSVNDTFGHATGDAVLRAVSEIALDTPRDSDLVGRLGGEEFAMILPGADIASATAVAEKLRSAIAGRRFAGDRPPLVTASFGVAALDPDRDDLESLLIRADEALYEAKHSGRNQVVAHEAEGSATLASSERQRLLAAGRLLFDGGQSVLDCTVRAIWDGGAEIQIAEAFDVPEAVVLEIPSQARSVKGAVRLRRPNGLELRFL